MSDYATRRKQLAALAETWPELTHMFLFAAGALYALDAATRGDVRDRADYTEADRPAHVDMLRDLLRALDIGHEPTAIFTAGFMFNSAIMRLDACYERFLKAISEELKVRGELRPLPTTTGTSDKLTYTEKLARRIELSLGLTLSRVHLEENRRDVNRLKHALFGREVAVAQARAVRDVDNASRAFDELLTILGVPVVHQALREAYQRLPNP